MKERPIIFSGEMVQALLDGRKTMTRRIVKPQPLQHVSIEGGQSDFYLQWDVDEGERVTQETREIKCPYGVPGDRLWVKETIRFRRDQDHLKPTDCIGRPWYQADDPTLIPSGCGGGAGKMRPSIYMPRLASRLTLEITDVRVERIQDISEKDGKAEGVNWELGEGTPNNRFVPAFEKLWNSIHGPGAWERDDWVWAISFKRICPTSTVQRVPDDV